MTDRVTTLQQRKARLELQIARQNTRARSTERRQDTRRKILIGAVVLAQAQENASWWAEILALLDQHLSRPFDRDLFDLPRGPGGK